MSAPGGLTIQANPCSYSVLSTAETFHSGVRRIWSMIVNTLQSFRDDFCLGNCQMSWDLMGFPKITTHSSRPTDAAGIHYKELHQTAAAMTTQCPGHSYKLIGTLCQHLIVLVNSLSTSIDTLGLKIRGFFFKLTNGRSNSLPKSQQHCSNKLLAFQQHKISLGSTLRCVQVTGSSPSCPWSCQDPAATIWKTKWLKSPIEENAYTIFISIPWYIYIYIYYIYIYIYGPVPLPPPHGIPPPPPGPGTPPARSTRGRGALALHTSYTLYTQPIHNLYAPYIHSIQSILILCTSYIHPIHILYTPYIHSLYTLYTIYIHSIYVVYTQYIVYVLSMHYSHALLRFFTHHVHVQLNVDIDMHTHLHVQIHPHL